MKGGACSWLAGPGLAPLVGHLGLNGRPVWSPRVMTSWEGSCFSWWWAGLCTAMCGCECMLLYLYEDKMSEEFGKSLKMRLYFRRSLVSRLVWIWLNPMGSSQLTGGGLSVGAEESFNLTQDVVDLVVAWQRPQLQKSGSVFSAHESREGVSDLTPSALALWNSSRPTINSRFS